MKHHESGSDANALPIGRRRLLTRLASGILLCTSGATLAAERYTKPGAFAEQLTRTASVEEGPFYPYHKLPLDTDNDLLIINDAITPAVGVVTHISGRLLDLKGDPIRNATIEIWQTDHNAVYLAEHSDRGGEFDPNFQGFGRFLTGSRGEYYFRTIKPVPYPGRTAPHIHFKVTRKGHTPWTTQLFIKGHPGNLTDGVYRRSGDRKMMASVTVDFARLKNSPIGELAATFDIVHGFTLEG